MALLCRWNAFREVIRPRSPAFREPVPRSSSCFSSCALCCAQTGSLRSSLWLCFLPRIWTANTQSRISLYRGDLALDSVGAQTFLVAGAGYRLGRANGARQLVAVG